MGEVGETTVWRSGRDETARPIAIIMDTVPWIQKRLNKQDKIMGEILKPDFTRSLLHPSEWEEGGETVQKRDVEEDTHEVKNHKFLNFPNHVYPRILLLFQSQMLYFVLGGGYYSFPMWLNQILPNHVAISDQDQSLLGGIIYVSLGLCGMLIMYFKSYQIGKVREFFALTLFGTVNVSVAWFIIVWLVWSAWTSSHAIWQVWLAMVLIGLGVGTFYMVLLGELLMLIKQHWHFLFVGVTSVMFSLGAVVGLALKLIMSDKDWIMMAFFINVLSVWLISAVAIVGHRYLFASDQEIASLGQHTQSTSPISTVQLMNDLVSWRRAYDAEQLLSNACDVSSLQFYLIFVSYLLYTAVGTAFMANLGPLTSNNDDTLGNVRSQVIVMIWAAIGQTVGRILVPVYTNYIKRHYDHVFRGVKTELSAKQAAAKQSIINNRTILSISLAISVLFTVSLLVLRFSKISFIVATTSMSVGYGAMWSVSSSFPMFFPGFDFTYLMCVQQVFGAFATLSFVLLISLLKFDNAETFEALLVVSVATVVVTIFALVSRISTEPSMERFEKLH